MHLRLFVISLATALLVAAPLAGATRAQPQPLTVRSASLTQAGRQLIWTVQLASSFSPAKLARDRRSLCLLLVRARATPVSGQLCVAGPRSGHRSPRLMYQQITTAGPGAAHVIAATVTRSGSRALTATFAPSSIGVSYRSLRWQVRSTLRPPSCTPATPNPVGCVTLYPASPALAKLHTPLLAGCAVSGPSWVFHGPSNVHEIALTFDDGPWPDPPTIDFVNLLAREHVPATFFEIGDQINEYDPTGSIERQMLADGDMIGDHTWTHPDMTKLDAAAQRQQLSQTAAAIRHATGFTPCLFRAPYGDVNSGLLGQARSLGFATIQWDVDPSDWKLPGVSAIYGNVVGNAHNGAIVIQHFGGGPRYETLAALPHEISTLRARGYKFVTVTQMLGYRLIYR